MGLPGAQTSHAKPPRTICGTAVACRTNVTVSVAVASTIDSHAASPGCSSTYVEGVAGNGSNHAAGRTARSTNADIPAPIKRSYEIGPLWSDGTC